MQYIEWYHFHARSQGEVRRVRSNPPPTHSRNPTDHGGNNPNHDCSISVFISQSDWLFWCVSIRLFKQRLYWRVSILSTLTVRLSLKRRSFWMLISQWLTSTTFRENS